MKNKTLRKEWNHTRNKYIRRGWRGWCYNLQHLDIEDIDFETKIY